MTKKQELCQKNELLLKIKRAFLATWVNFILFRFGVD